MVGTRQYALDKLNILKSKNYINENKAKASPIGLLFVLNFSFNFSLLLYFATRFGQRHEEKIDI